MKRYDVGWCRPLRDGAAWEPLWCERLIELGDFHRRAVNHADDLFQLRVADALLVDLQVQDRFKVFQRAFHLRIFAQFSADQAFLQARLNLA